MLSHIRTPVLAICCFLNTLGQASAQYNFVPNGSFELHNNCPVSISGVAKEAAPQEFVRDWIAPTQGTSDYFHACSYHEADVPLNFSGYQPAQHGEAYCGIIALVTDDTLSNAYAYREYLLVRLKEPLTAGKRYCVSFYASPGEHLSNGIGRKFVYGTNALGLYFSNTSTVQYGPDITAPPLPYTPQITASTVMADTSRWYAVGGIYTAAGGEEWITIGNFNDNPNTKNLQLISPGLLDEPDKHFVYFYIDNVQVFEADKPLALPADKWLCAKDFPVTLSASPGLENLRWNTGDTTTSIVAQQEGVFSLTALKDGCLIHDTVNVTLVPPPELDLGNDIENCLDGIAQTVTLQNSAELNNYQWSTGEHTAQILVSEAGTYYLSTYDYCGTFTDSLRVTGCVPAIYVPNVFAPSAIGINSVFLPQGKNVSFERLQVFNNWGVMVYQEEKPTQGWDGTYGNKPCHPGVYMWFLTYREGSDTKLLVKKGDITLIR